MGADCYFRMGSTHSVCQDYAISGVRYGRPFAIVSDGCSGRKSGAITGYPFTDFGARFLALSAFQDLEALSNGVFPKIPILNRAREMVKGVFLQDTALDATLLVAAQAPSGDIYVTQSADGIVAARKRDGTIVYRVTDYGNNMPYYLNYFRDLNLHLDYLNKARTVTRTFGERAPDGTWLKSRDETSNLDMLPIEESSDLYPANTYDLVLVLSDGAKSFRHRKTGETVEIQTILDELFAIKSYPGEFLVRRCNRFLQTCVERDWYHMDDFSVGGIHIDSPRSRG